MANHRAPRRALARRRPVDLDVTSSSHSARPAPGRRRAVPSDARRTHTGEGAILPLVSSAPLFVGAAAMVLAAVGAVTVSVPDASAGLVSTDVRQSSRQVTALPEVRVVASSASLENRERAVSRDSQREAQKDAADRKLQAAAEKQAKERKAALAALAASAEKQAGRIARNTWRLPVDNYRLTSSFGQCSSLWSQCHTGLDFAAPSGSPIRSVANGTVTEVGYAGAYGNRTIVTLENGTEVWFCHQTSSSVRTGQRVSAGEVIGTVGSTGNSTGPHLHLEVRPGAGDPVDPAAALAAHGLKP